MSKDEPDEIHSKHGGSHEGCALSHATKGVRRGLRTIGTIPEGERHGAEWRALESWCREEGLIAPADCVPEREGGREHDLRMNSGSRIWLKFTKPWACGYAVDVSGATPALFPATPLQYFERLRLQNQYFGDSIRFAGITADPRQRRIMISQPDIVGRPADWSELDDWFLHEGFSKLPRITLGGYDSAAFVGHGIGVFDVRPVNVVVDNNGAFLPIDLIVRRLTPRQILRLLALGAD